MGRYMTEEPKEIKDQKQIWYVKKSQWRERVDDIDEECMKLFARESYRILPLGLFEDIALKVEKAGLRGETLADEGARLGVTEIPIDDISRRCNRLEDFSLKIQRIAESKFRGTLNRWPVYTCSLEPPEEGKLEEKVARVLEEA